VHLTAEATQRVLRGQGVAGETGPGEYARAYNAAGEFIAILRADTAAGQWRPHKVFSEG
jgi:hypothetical protein